MKHCPVDPRPLLSTRRFEQLDVLSQEIYLARFSPAGAQKERHYTAYLTEYMISSPVNSFSRNLNSPEQPFQS